MRYVPPKRRLTKYLHGATSQKTASPHYAIFSNLLFFVSSFDPNILLSTLSSIRLMLLPLHQRPSSQAVLNTRILRNKFLRRRSTVKFYTLLDPTRSNCVTAFLLPDQHVSVDVHSPVNRNVLCLPVNAALQ
jgi:hypothetical protein